MNSYEYSVRATGLGSQKTAYEELLLALAASGMRLTRIRIAPAGLASTLIDCTLEGSSDEYAILRRKLNV